MSLIHNFSIIKEYPDKEKIYSGTIYEDILDGITKEIDSIEISDDFLQELLYDSSGFPLLDSNFSEWGIDVYGQEELSKWIDLLNNTPNKDKEKDKISQKLIHFIKKAQKNHNYIVHFGV